MLGKNSFLLLEFARIVGGAGNGGALIKGSVRGDPYKQIEDAYRRIRVSEGELLSLGSTQLLFWWWW